MWKWWDRRGGKRYHNVWQQATNWHNYIRIKAEQLFYFDRIRIGTYSRHCTLVDFHFTIYTRLGSQNVGTSRFSKHTTTNCEFQLFESYNYDDRNKSFYEKIARWNGSIIFFGKMKALRTICIHDKIITLNRNDDVPIYCIVNDQGTLKLVWSFWFNLAVGVAIISNGLWWINLKFSNSVTLWCNCKFWVH